MCNRVSTDELAHLLGRQREDPRVTAMIAGLVGATDVTVDRRGGADEEYVEAREYGLCFYFDHGTLSAIFLYATEKDSSYEEYAGDLPLGVRFDHNVKCVTDSLGPPSSAHQGGSGFFGPISPWLSYDLESYGVHFEFADDGSKIKLVTLLCSEASKNT